MFVIILRYVVEKDIIEPHRPAHREFLDKYYAKGVFHASGPQIPIYGGTILAVANNREELQELIKEDPFYIEKCAEYNIFEFTLFKKSAAFENFLNSL